MKRPVRLLGRAAPNPKFLQNPFGPLGNPELESKTSTGEPTNTLNSTVTLPNKFRRHNPNSIHSPVEHGDNRRGGRANGKNCKKKRRLAVPKGRERGRTAVPATGHAAAGRDRVSERRARPPRWVSPGAERALVVIRRPGLRVALRKRTVSQAGCTATRIWPHRRARRRIPRRGR